jgi:hypothetical protein
MNNIDCEMDFLKDDQSRVIAMVGVKGSSKTFTTLNFIKFALVSKRFKNAIHLIFPSYKNDNDQEQYEYLKHADKKQKINIYSKYSPLVIKHIVNNTDKTKGASLVVIDDSTSSGQDISSDQTFLHFVTTSRHLNITLILIAHNLRKVFNPTIRSNIDYFFFFRIINSKLLEAVFEEYFSMYPDFKNYKDFKDFYFNNVLKEEYQGLFLDSRNNKYCTNIKQWHINTFDFSKYFNGKSKKIKPVDVDTDKDKILMRLEQKEIKENIQDSFLHKKK